MDLRGLRKKTVLGAVYERILRLKRSRSGSKAAVTRRQTNKLRVRRGKLRVKNVVHNSNCL